MTWPSTESMPGRHTKGGPQGSTPRTHPNSSITFDVPTSVNPAEDMRPLLLAAAELVDDLTAVERHRILAYRWGYRDGFASGEVVGAQRTERELTAVWDRQGEHVHKVNGRPVYSELERIRWDGRREDFGKPRPGDFAGMGADYQPPTYYVPLHPGGASRHREGAA